MNKEAHMEENLINQLIELKYVHPTDNGAEKNSGNIKNS